MCSANIFRTLYPDEIDVRVQQVAERDGKARAILLLYKNARVDMDMLDEQFGCLGWQREHSFKEGKNYCKVSVYDTTKQVWVAKEDVGVESNTEETKGEASDAFKRACVNLGIGRELYSAPQIVIDLNPKEWKTNPKTNRAQINSWIKYRVAAITYNPERRIIGLSIVDANGNVRFTMGSDKPQIIPSTQQQVVAQPQRERKTLTTDKIMDESFLKTLCEWLHKNNNGRGVESIIRQYYDCDDDTLNCITNEYNRIYATGSTQNA